MSCAGLEVNCCRCTMVSLQKCVSFKSLELPHKKEAPTIDFQRSHLILLTHHCCNLFTAGAAGEKS